MSLDRAEKFARLRLWRTPRVGPATYRNLIARFGDAQTVLARLPDHVRAMGRTPARIPTEQSITEEIKALHAMGGRFVFADTPEYPSLLHAADDAPPVLATLGNIDLLNSPCLAIVGSRNASLNGKHLTRAYATALGQRGYVIVSGLAKGIDAAAHEAALPTGTIAVVAGGLDVIYPRENADLHRRIAAGGLLISEQPLGMPTSARLFPLRNRLVSGLSFGTLVMEAHARSGSLITARLAGEQGRDVFAVPGSPLEGRSQGTNQLLKDGAILVTSIEDIVNAAPPTTPAPYTAGFHEPDPAHAPTVLDETQIEPLKAQILENLTLDPTAIDALALECQVAASQMQSALTDLEITGQIIRIPGGLLAKAP